METEFQYSYKIKKLINKKTHKSKAAKTRRNRKEKAKKVTSGAN